MNELDSSELYTEREVAERLQITLPRLHLLLDKYFFSDGSPRPQELTFTYSEIVLLSFWHGGQPDVRVSRERAK